VIEAVLKNVLSGPCVERNFVGRIGGLLNRALKSKREGEAEKESKIVAVLVSEKKKSHWISAIPN
jgi:hypothetical protein